ncbi:hypothetical protein PAXRUDRAFT_20647 [Paxillus rubicundulus Ve08.2h10]|uniref:Unplaced genomic scaffold scaffold_4737, whole genome shotgun sequence n=1 Tax=Paxillus rubicundulus Ve08.2h10 TaxID=930991 RepID=A0A0D0CS08_9AGAM|nr:hypothetical protein PAXRUDRAFT_20647 [Paxillus rubicundulus Ve08.2h10]
MDKDMSRQAFKDPSPSQADLNGRWKYSWTIIIDGNFKAEHMDDKKPDDQVFLMDGKGYMVGQEKYHDYLKAAKDAPEVRL